MKSLLRWLVVVVAIIGVAGAVAFLGLGFYLSPQSPLSKADAIVAISGGETDSRAAEAIRLFKAGWAPTLIFSGAASDPNSPSNAATMRRSALKAGVPDADILLDEVSANTAQNASGVAKIATDHNYHSIILVTSPYHQRRASLTFRTRLGKGVAIINHSTTDESWRRSAWWVNGYSFNLTISELQKTLFVIWSQGGGQGS